jgi:hypothetical protein
MKALTLAPPCCFRDGCEEWLPSAKPSALDQQPDEGRDSMAHESKFSVAADRDFANLFWRVTWMSFVTGLAASVLAAGVVLLIAAAGG